MKNLEIVSNTVDAVKESDGSRQSKKSNERNVNEMGNTNPMGLSTNHLSSIPESNVSNNGRAWVVLPINASGNDKRERRDPPTVQLLSDEVKSEMQIKKRKKARASMSEWGSSENMNGTFEFVKLGTQIGVSFWMCGCIEEKLFANQTFDLPWFLVTFELLFFCTVTFGREWYRQCHHCILPTVLWTLTHNKLVHVSQKEKEIKDSIPELSASQFK
ncbi:hypothetical protein RFI_06411 [Reticulomyxa filosa]|uniref:Uncharacterized protein n=1 Tax=Reticulomyxa filosa TaxID=46433 RepID=X6NXI2_RETFI|nr:hypothetical protein RFI_06411 [Reticulomyxa filosa]|eukprot:ETO30711.1 hypothetical protein RFI_06411 [Reticulomyxa filosa]